MKTPFKKSTSKAKPIPVNSKPAEPLDELGARWDDAPSCKALWKAIDLSAPLNCSALVNRILQLHKTRDIRAVSGVNKLTVEQCTEIAYKESACRSNIVEIVAQCAAHKISIETLQRKAKALVTAGDANWLNDNIKTVGERTALVNALLIDADTRIGELQMVIEVGDRIIADIDKSGYTSKLTGEMFALTFKTEQYFGSKHS
jgi:hypothetical protein